MASPRVPACALLAAVLLAGLPASLAEDCKQTVASKCFPGVGNGCTLFSCFQWRNATCHKEDVFGMPIGTGTCVCTGGYCGLNGKCVPPTTCFHEEDSPGFPVEGFGAVAGSLAAAEAAPIATAEACEGEETVASNCHPVVGNGCTIFTCHQSRGATCWKQEVFGMHIGIGHCVCPAGTCGLNGKCVPPTACMKPGDAPGAPLPSLLAAVRPGTAGAAAVAVAGAGVGAAAGLAVLKASRSRAAAGQQAAAQEGEPTAPFAPLAA